MSNTFDKLSVLNSFIEEVNSYLPEIETNLGRLAQSTDDMEALEESYRRAHTIGGSASMMDFPGLAHVAHGMEDILGDVLDNLAKLDPPTLGLLHRSLERVHRLIDGIRKGIDENAVIAEDDADYMQYRSQLELSVRATSDQGGAFVPTPAQEPGDVSSPSGATPAIPSLDEMLASFRTPGASVGEEVSWPEDPVPISSADVRLQQNTQPRQPLPTPPTASFEPARLSALEMLATPTPRVPDRPPVTPGLPVVDESEVAPAPLQEQMRGLEAARLIANAPVPLSSERGANVPAQVDGASVAQIYHKMQEDARVLDDQAASFKRTLTQLRLAATVVEAQRTEFKGFLDGSKDALDRMEEWAGKAMGLNLRNSPEQVRRYLPLSVMWVANSKLKKVLDLLVQMTGNIEMTDEQMQASMAQLQASIDACGEAIDQLQVASSSGQPWSPWARQVSRDTVHERVTFERHADIAALRAEIEAGLREEYERRPPTVATRAELERQIRSELRGEFEARRHLQESVIGTGTSESLQELEARLRQEIEITVRSEFLSTLIGEADETPGATFIDQAAALQAPLSLSAVPSKPALSATPSRPAPSAPYISPQAADFGEEAAEIFKLEAEEHLQTISMFVASLEKAPTDLEPIQGIRRATHTLKGAAGMMGFRSIADLCHISEDLLDSVMEETIPITPAVLSIILDTAEALDILINAKGASGEGAAAVELLRKRYNQILGEQPSLANVIDEELEADIEASEAVILQEATAKSVVDANLVGAGMVEMQQMARGDLSVRVPLTKLNELVNLFGELLVNRSILEEKLQRLVRLVSDAGVSSNRLRDVGQKLESRFEAATLPSGRSVQVMPGQGNTHVNGHNGAKNANGRVEPAHLAEFDKLELDRYTEFHQLARGLSEGISDMTTLSNEMDADHP